MKPTIGDPCTVRFCAANVINHNLKARLEALQKKGFTIQIERCLNNCGPCRHTAHCHYGDESLTLDAFLEKISPRS
jgi:hypothetical protein